MIYFRWIRATMVLEILCACCYIGLMQCTPSLDEQAMDQADEDHIRLKKVTLAVEGK